MSGDATCRDVHGKASAYVDGEVEGVEWRSLTAHLAICPPCEEYVRQLGVTVEVLRRLPGQAGVDARAELLRRFEAWSRGQRP